MMSSKDICLSYKQLQGGGVGGRSELLVRILAMAFCSLLWRTSSAGGVVRPGAILKTYAFLTSEFWKETHFSKSPFQEHTDLLGKPTLKALLLDDAERAKCLKSHIDLDANWCKQEVEWKKKETNLQLKVGQLTEVYYFPYIRFFPRRVKILETVAQCKCCVMMLDIGSNDLVLELFNTFFSALRKWTHHRQSNLNKIDLFSFHPS